MKLSVSIICSNNENTIDQVLKSIKDLADEIIVIVDHNSKDKTEEIARNYTEKVSVEPWRGFLAQKNEALSRCSGEWILDLDSDEVVTPELLSEIKEVINDPLAKDGYYLNRRTYYVGKYLNYAWKPDWRLRLVRKNAKPIWAGDPIHSLLEIQSSRAYLKGYLDHFSYQDIEDHFLRTMKYAKGGAEIRFKNGKEFHLLKAMLAPPFAFFKQYFLKRALLDGFRGFIAAVSAGIYSFLKEIYLWEYHVTNKKDKS